MMQGIRQKMGGVQVRVFASLMWATAGRAGDVLTLHKEDIDYKDTQENTIDVRVSMKRGKGAKMGGPYIIPTCLPRAEVLELEAYLRDMTPTARIFPLAAKKTLTDELKKELKAVLPTASLPSVRKGAIKHLAAAGVPEAILMLITGHKTKASLYAYLGKVPTTDTLKASKAAQALHVPLPLSGGGPRARWPSGNDGRDPEGRRIGGVMNITQAPSRRKLGLEEEATGPLPLHLKQTSKVDVGKVAEIARKAGKEIFFKGLPYYNGEAFRGCDTSRILKNNVWAEEDVEKMLEHERLEPIPLMGKYLPTTGGHAASIFTVEEREKKRRRIITEPRLNGCMGDT
jgi:hypothetical protein